MPYRVEPFVYEDEREIYQGRMYYGQGAHYWGSSQQGSQTVLDSSAESCEERDTYLVLTSFSNVTTNIVVGLQSVQLMSGALVLAQGGMALLFTYILY